MFLHDAAVRSGAIVLYDDESGADFARRRKIWSAIFAIGLQQRFADKTLAKRRMRRLRGKMRSNSEAAW